MAPHIEACDLCGEFGEVGETMRQCEFTGDFVCQQCDDSMTAAMDEDCDGE